MPDFPDNTSDYRVVRTIREDGSEEFTIQDMNNPGADGPQPAYPIGYSREEMWNDWKTMMRAFAQPDVVVDTRSSGLTGGGAA